MNPTPLVGFNEQMQAKADAVFARQIWFETFKLAYGEEDCYALADEAAIEFMKRVKVGFFTVEGQG